MNNLIAKTISNEDLKAFIKEAKLLKSNIIVYDYSHNIFAGFGHNEHEISYIKEIYYRTDHSLVPYFPVFNDLDFSFVAYLKDIVALQKQSELNNIPVEMIKTEPNLLVNNNSVGVEMRCENTIKPCLPMIASIREELFKIGMVTANGPDLVVNDIQEHPEFLPLYQSKAIDGIINIKYNGFIIVANPMSLGLLKNDKADIEIYQDRYINYVVMTIHKSKNMDIIIRYRYQNIITGLF